MRDRVLDTQDALTLIMAPLEDTSSTTKLEDSVNVKTKSWGVKLLTLTEGRIVPLDPPASAASGGSSDSIDKLFDEGDDAGQKHSIKRDDDVLKEAIAKDVSEVAVEKTKKKRKRKAVGDASGSTLPLKKLREDYRAATSNVGGKSLATIHGLIPEGSSVPSGVTEPLVVASVTPTPDGGYDGPTYFMFGLNLQTRPPGTGVSVAITSKLNKPATSFDSFYASQDLDSETLHNIYVPKWKVTNDFILDDPYVCRDLTDRLAPLALFSQLRAIDYDQLYTEFNVGAARQMCLGAKVRMRVEHTLEQKDRLEDKCAEQTALLSEKDAEIAHLKSLLSLREAEAVKAIHLREKDVLSEKVTTLESVTALKETELVTLTSQVVQLTSNLYGFQLSHDELSSKLDAQLLEMPTHLEEEFYPRFLTAISRRRWILTHGLKLVLLKCLQSSEYLQALGQAIGCAINKAKYVDAMSVLRTVDFSLLSVLKSKKDASIVDLMDFLRLEGPLAEIPGAKELQPSPKQLMLPIHRVEDDVILDVMVPLAEPLYSQSLIGKASTSAAPATAELITTLSTTFESSNVVPPSVSDYQVSDPKPHDKDPSAITFEEKELDIIPESAVVS
ncbi:hypothetical protein Tco_0400042 [Tanacetum coccineum]